MSIKHQSSAYATSTAKRILTQPISFIQLFQFNFLWIFDYVNYFGAKTWEASSTDIFAFVRWWIISESRCKNNFLGFVWTRCEQKNVDQLWCEVDSREEVEINLQRPHFVFVTNLWFFIFTYLEANQVYLIALLDVIVRTILNFLEHLVKSALKSVPINPLSY